MLNFTVSPVTLSEESLKISSEQMPYFRTPEFSELMLENERIIKELSGLKNGRAIFLTASGTAAMESAVINSFDENDKILIVDSGDYSFGHRFVDICKVYNIPFETIRPEFGCSVSEMDLKRFDNKGFTGFLVNLCETSTGVLHNIKVISDFCKRNNLFLVVDAVSSFLCEELSMDESFCQVMVTTSSKALACQPGVSVVVLSDAAVERVYKMNPQTFYLDLKSALKNGERGQTPFTCAVSCLCQINQRLKEIEANGGTEWNIKRVKELSHYFRNKINDLNLDIKIPIKDMSNVVTTLSFKNISAFKVYEILRQKYNITVNPNGGELKDRLFRVGHIGDLNEKDFDVLISALKELKENNLI